MTQVTDETFQQEVLSSDLPVLVDFYADWCGPCKAAAPTIDAIATEFEGKAKVVKLNVDNNTKFAVENQVRGIPNFIIFKGGQKVAQFVGWSEKVADEIHAALTAALASN
jgi:thioredoxin 1